MKILMIHHSRDIGGGTLSCFDVINSLIDNGHDVSLILPPGKHDAYNEAKRLGITVIDTNFNIITYNYYNGGSNVIRVTARYLITSVYKNRWRKYIEDYNPDVVLLNSLVQWPMLSLLNKLNIKSICFVRETMKGKNKSLINKLIKINLEKASGVSFISQFDKESWNLSNNVKQLVIPDMVDLEEFCNVTSKQACRVELGLEKDKFYVLYVGGMNKLKGAHVILKAMARCQEKNIELLFLGDLGKKNKDINLLKKIFNYRTNKFVNKMYCFVENTNLYKSVKFVGKINDMKKWYRACDLIVFPATKAHQSRPLYEAGAFKKPVIVTKFINYEEYLIENYNGVYFENEDFEDLKNKIQFLYTNDKVRKSMGENNFYMTQKLHNSKFIKIKIEKLLNTIKD